MSNATFFNFDTEAFTGYWNGKPKTFKPGERQLMPAWLAEHFAKHLTNRVLIRDGKEVYTSPKKPLQVPEFMEVFNKAFIPEKRVEGGNEIDDIIAGASVSTVLEDGPSSNIQPTPQGKPVDDSSPAQAAAVMRGEDPSAEAGADQADPWTPTGNETGPGGASTVIGEAGDDDDYESNDGGNA